MFLASVLWLYPRLLDLIFVKRTDIVQLSFYTEGWLKVAFSGSLSVPLLISKQLDTSNP